jgi:hypothetical protein
VAPRMMSHEASPPAAARDHGLLGRVNDFQIASADQASSPVKKHSVASFISFFKCFLHDFGGQPRCCAVGFATGYKDSLFTTSKRCLIVLTKLDVLKTFHRQ